jgi:geranylgeranyl pyrophosphate synthase
MPGRCSTWRIPFLYDPFNLGARLKATTLLEIVQDELLDVEKKMKAVAIGQVPELSDVVDYLIASGGKRLRPALTMISSHFYPAEYDKVVCLAAAVEMLHTATLVHDDLIDNALLRRGHPTLNASLSPGATILTGDFLFGWAANLAAETNHPGVISVFAQTLMTIVGGELQQYFHQRRMQPPTREEYFQRIYSKTASLFASAAQTGAMISNAPADTINGLREYGENLGLAFQIMDDILDFSGDKERLGKPIANDMRQGVITLPVLYYMEMDGTNSTLAKAIKHEPLSDAEVDAFLVEIQQSGAIISARQEAVRLVKKAQESLAILPDNRYKETLYYLAEFAASRDV